MITAYRSTPYSITLPSRMSVLNSSLVEHIILALCMGSFSKRKKRKTAPSGALGRDWRCL